jgi:hypothetical protein
MKLLLSLFTACLFILLVPGILVRIPRKGSLLTAAIVHALVFAVVYSAFNRFLFVHVDMFMDTASIDCVVPTTFTGGVTLKAGSILPDGTTLFKSSLFPIGTKLPIIIDKFDDPSSIPAAIPANTASTVEFAIVTNVTFPKGFTTNLPINCPLRSCYEGKIDASQRFLLPVAEFPRHYIIPKGTTFAGTTTRRGQKLPVNLPYVDANGSTGTINAGTLFTQMLTSTADIELPQKMVTLEAIIYPSGYIGRNTTTPGILLSSLERNVTPEDEADMANENTLLYNKSLLSYE